MLRLLLEAQTVQNFSLKSVFSGGVVVGAAEAEGVVEVGVSRGPSTLATVLCGLDCSWTGGVEGTAGGGV